MMKFGAKALALAALVTGLGAAPAHAVWTFDSTGVALDAFFAFPQTFSAGVFVG